MHFSYTSLNGYFSGSLITTYLAVLIIFPVRKTYFKRKVLICFRNSEMTRKSSLNSKNRLYESIINWKKASLAQNDLSKRCLTGIPLITTWWGVPVILGFPVPFKGIDVIFSIVAFFSRRSLRVSNDHSVLAGLYYPRSEAERGLTERGLWPIGLQWLSVLAW